MLVDEVNKLNEKIKKPKKKQYIIADIVFEHDMFYIVKIGNTISTIMKTDNVIVHNYEEGEK